MWPLWARIPSEDLDTDDDHDDHDDHDDNDLCNGEYDKDISKDNNNTEEEKQESPIVFACLQSTVE